MRFGYSYKTSDGVRHEAECTAKVKEEVFERLRAEGIRAMKVWEIRSPYAVSKRTAVIVVLVLALAAALLALKREKNEVREEIRKVRAERVDTAPRRCFDPSVPRPSLTTPGDAFLLRFVAPATVPAPTTPAATAAAAADLRARLADPVPDRIGESRAEAEIRAIVRTLKQEVRDIVANGRTVEEALAYFGSRQEMEVEHRRRIVDQVARGEMDKAAANAVFRTMGFEELR